MTPKIAPEDYVLKFGKYKNMRAVDVAEIYTVDGEGNDKPVGLVYLEWLCSQDWFKHTDILEQAICNARNAMSDEADSEPEPEPQPKKKKEKKDKELKKGTVKIAVDEECKTLNFEK